MCFSKVLRCHSGVTDETGGISVKKVQWESISCVFLFCCWRSLFWREVAAECSLEGNCFDARFCLKKTSARHQSRLGRCYYCSEFNATVRGGKGEEGGIRRQHSESEATTRSLRADIVLQWKRETRRSIDLIWLEAIVSSSSSGKKATQLTYRSVEWKKRVLVAAWKNCRGTGSEGSWVVSLGPADEPVLIVDLANAVWFKFVFCVVIVREG